MESPIQANEDPFISETTQDSAAVESPVKLETVPFAETLQQDFHGDINTASDRSKHPLSDVPANDDTLLMEASYSDCNTDAQESRSASLMKRIEKIKERLSLSSLNYSHDDEESFNLRSKSLPFKMHSVTEIQDEAIAELPNHRVEDNASPQVSPNNRSKVSANTPLDASHSFQSLTTISSCFGGEAEDHTKPMTGQVNTSGLSHGSSISPTPSRATSPCKSTSSSQNVEMEEDSEYFVDEQRANVVEKLRGAAFRRRMDVSRSRDSLLAKEQRQREQNQVVVQVPVIDDKLIGGEPKKRQSNTKPGHFKALPLPKTTGCEGSFGLSGVPAIKTKGTTAAHSPMLGRRRQKKISVSANHSSTRVPLPPPIVNEGGLAGIPMIFKKATTVPRSPLLGRRRAQSVKPEVNRRPSLPIMKRKSVESNSTNSSGSLLGLAICTSKENDSAPPALETPTVTRRKSLQPFIPHSTKRAAARNAYDIRRAEHEQTRRENQKRERKVLIKRLERDIEKIRLKL